VGTLERDEFLRAAWKVMLAERVEAEQLVLRRRDGLEHLALCFVRLGSHRSAGAMCSVPRNRGANTTVLSSMTLEGMGPALTVEGATTSVVFEAYVEQVLAPTLRRGQVVVLETT
jgi:hypothetical protein